ncbi:type IV pili biogenesis protein PilE, partial [Pseudomonas putida SJ3]
LPSGLMAQDRCGDFQLDQAGAQRNPGAVGGSEHCWGS